MPVLTLLWAAFNSVDFGNFPDMYPFLACVAFWCGWLAQLVVEAASRMSPASARPWLRPALGAALLLASLGYGLEPDRA